MTKRLPNEVYREIIGLSEFDRQSMYGIELLDNNKVMDNLESKVFDTLMDWVDFYLSEDDTPTFEKYGSPPPMWD